MIVWNSSPAKICAICRGSAHGAARGSRGVAARARGQACQLRQSRSIAEHSPPTAKSWVELLEKLYIIFLLPPYSNRLSRSIRKDRRIYFLDCAAAYDETGGAQLENLVACSLLKYAQFRKDAVGESWEIFYLRDKESREVDFVVTFNRRVHWLIEVQASDDDPSTSLRYYTEKLRPHQSLQLVLNLDRTQENRESKSCRWANGSKNCHSK